MKAVNLIPADAAGGRGGRGSATGAYTLLGVLTVLVVGVAAFVLTHNSVVQRRGELASLRTEVAAAQVQAQATKPYRDFAALAQARVQTVRQLGQTRFDWHQALGDLSKVIPRDVWLTSLLGTVTTGVTVEGSASGATGSLRSALPNPAIELTGCTTSQDGVVRLISRLRLIDGVQRVALADSSKGDSAGGNGDSSDSGDCRHGHDDFPQFDLVVFFDALPALPAAPSATAGSTVPAADTSGAAATPQPAPSSSGSSSSGSDLR